MNDSIIRQHDQTYNRANLGSNVLPVGPFSRSQFPLLKLERKNKEYFLRADKFCVTRYYLDNNKNQQMETIYYPSKKAIDELNLLKGQEEANNIYVKLYDKLINDGLGSTSIHIRKPFQKLPLKSKEKSKSKKLVLKSKNKKKLELKQKPKKLMLKKKSKLNLKRRE